MIKNRKHENEYYHAISISSYLKCYYTSREALENETDSLMEHTRIQLLEVASQITHKQLNLLSEDLNLNIKRPPISIVNDDMIEAGIVIMVFDVQGNTVPYLHPNYNKIPDYFYEYEEYTEEDMIRMGYYDELSEEEIDTMYKKDFFFESIPKTLKKKRG